jgi:hypothetical protein
VLTVYGIPSAPVEQECIRQIFLRINVKLCVSAALRETMDDHGSQRNEEVHLQHEFRADLLVEEAVIVEIKSLEVVPKVAPKVLLTYLRLSDKRLGLLINFGEGLVNDGIRRVVNNF